MKRKTRTTKTVTVADHHESEMLIRLLQSLQSDTEVRAFVDDFLTPAEKQTFAKRLAIYQALSERQTYQKIKNQLGVSSATISVAAEQMQSKGVQLLLQLCAVQDWASRWQQRLQTLLHRN